MDLNQFDHFFDAVAAFDKEGKVIYCNEAFAAIAGVSTTRIINKSNILKLLLEIDDVVPQLESLIVTEASKARVVHFKTKALEKGIGQYSLVPIQYKSLPLTLFILRDLTLEESLKKKYRAEMASKDHKIEEMKSLIKLLQKTRLVKEPLGILKEFAVHVLHQFQFEKAYVINSDQQIHFVSLRPNDTPDMLLNFLQKSKLPTQYIVYSSGDLLGLKIGFIPDLEKLIVIPIRAQKSSLLVIPVYEKQTLNLDHEIIKTLSEQMALMLDNMTLEKLSIFDDLTKLFNPRYFREKLDEQTATFKTLSLILLDIDFFKKVNDTYGHLAGDLVLTKMGEVLKSIEIKDSVVARVGGEEFAILLPNLHSTEVKDFAEKMADKIRALEINYDGTILKITSSFGIATWQPGRLAVREFYKLADAALYESKKNGRDRITFHKAS